MNSFVHFSPASICIKHFVHFSPPIFYTFSYTFTAICNHYVNSLYSLLRVFKQQSLMIIIKLSTTFETAQSLLLCLLRKQSLKSIWRREWGHKKRMQAHLRKGPGLIIKFKKLRAQILITHCQARQ